VGDALIRIFFRRPAGFPLQDRGPYRELHARRGRFGVLSLVQGAFPAAPGAQTLPLRFATVASLHAVRSL
jgi:hypothetical protein